MTDEATWLASKLTKEDAEGIRQAAEMLTSQKAVTQRDRGVTDEDGTIRIGGAGSVSDLYEQMATLRWSKLSPKLIPYEVRKTPHAMALWRGLETARTNNVATEYFGKDIAASAEVSRLAALAPHKDRPETMVGGLVRGYVRGVSEEQVKVEVTDWATQRGAEMREDAEAARLAFDYMDAEIQKAVQTDDPFATMRTAMRLATVLQYFKDNPPPDGGKGKGEGEQGDKGDQKGKGEGKGEGQPQDDGAGQEGGQPGQDEAKDKGSKSKPDAQPGVEKALGDAKREQDAHVDEAKQNVDASEKATEDMRQYGGWGAGGRSDLDPNQASYYGEVQGLSYTLDGRIRAKLATSLDSASSIVTSLQRRGRLTNRAWRLGHGDFKVFGRPPKHKGRVVILVDGSSSMGGNCECHAKRGFTNGWLAWQIVGLLVERFPDAEVFGYTSDSNGPRIDPTWPRQMTKNAGIYKMKGGARAAYCGEEANPDKAPLLGKGGTPDSNALVWIENYMHQVEDVTLIHICDGQPNNPGATYFQARKLYDKGMRYASIVVGPAGNTSDIYPADTTASIMRVDDFGAIEEVIELASARGG